MKNPQSVSLKKHNPMKCIPSRLVSYVYFSLYQISSHFFYSSSKMVSFPSLSCPHRSHIWALPNQWTLKAQTTKKQPIRQQIWINAEGFIGVVCKIPKVSDGENDGVCVGRRRESEEHEGGHDPKWKEKQHQRRRRQRRQDQGQDHHGHR